MRSKWLVIVAAVCLAYLLLGHLTNLRSYRELPQLQIEMRQAEVHSEILALRDSSELSADEKSTLYEQMLVRAKLLFEINVRRYYVDQLVTLMFSLVILLLFVNRLRRKQESLTTSKDEIIRDMNVHIEDPREQYVDEWELHAVSRDGFQSKDEAIHWLKNDPMLTCDYCGSRLRSTFTGDREAIQLVTFYKKVPQGAKDLRVVLGTYWFPKHATELKCSQCGKVEVR